MHLNGLEGGDLVPKPLYGITAGGSAPKGVAQNRCDM